jgi:hypothetical protein
VDAIFIVIFSALIGWHLIKLTQWLSNKSGDEESQKIKKINQRNKFLIGVIVILLLDAVKNLIVIWLPEQKIASTHLLVLELNEWLFLFISIALFLFAQNYFLVIGIMRGYFFVSEIPSTHSGSSTPISKTKSTLKTGTGTSSAIKKSASQGSTIVSVNSSSNSSTTSIDDRVMTKVASEDKVTTEGPSPNLKRTNKGKKK